MGGFKKDAIHERLEASVPGACSSTSFRGAEKIMELACRNTLASKPCDVTSLSLSESLSLSLKIAYPLGRRLDTSPSTDLATNKTEDQNAHPLS